MRTRACRRLRFSFSFGIRAWNAANHVILWSSSGGLTTFSIFATFPASYYHSNMLMPFLDQVIGTFLMMPLILAIGDAKNTSVRGNMGPFMVGIAVAAVGMSFGTGAGYAINPARDFGPRFFTWLTKWGSNAFPGPHGYWWVPIVSPLVGAPLAVFVYRFFIEKTLTVRAEPTAKQNTVKREPVSNRALPY